MSISSYCSLAYLAVFLPAVILLYSLAPRKARPFALLFASYGFFWMVSGKLLAFLLVSTFSIHHAGIWLALTQKERAGYYTFFRDRRPDVYGEIVKPH